MTKTFFIFLILGIVVLTISACSDNGDCDPNTSCDTNQPDSGYVHLYITMNSENLAVPITVYHGYVEDNEIYFRDTICDKDIYYYVPVDERYSVQAKYKKGSKTIVAMDGGKLKVTRKDNCSETCYEVNDLVLKLELE